MNNTGIKPKVIEEIRTFAKNIIQIRLYIGMRAKESFYDMFCELKKRLIKTGYKIYQTDFLTLVSIVLCSKNKYANVVLPAYAGYGENNGNYNKE